MYSISILTVVNALHLLCVLVWAVLLITYLRLVLLRKMIVASALLSLPAWLLLVLAVCLRLLHMIFLFIKLDTDLAIVTLLSILVSPITLIPLVAFVVYHLALCLLVFVDISHQIIARSYLHVLSWWDWIEDALLIRCHGWSEYTHVCALWGRLTADIVVDLLHVAHRHH